MADYESEEQEIRFSLRSFLVKDWPYLLMLALAIFGVAYESTSRTPMTVYWMVLAPLFGIITVAAHWRAVPDPNERWRLVRTQVLHWVAVMFAMNLVLVADVKQMMGADGDALAVLTVLALGTFTAGIHAEAWRIGLVGILLGLGVPGMAWLQRSTVLIFLVAVVLITFASFMFLHKPAHKRAKPTSP
jgi:hypothetical protein